MKKIIALTALGLILSIAHIAAAAAIGWALWFIGVPGLYAALLCVPLWALLSRLLFRNGETISSALNKANSELI